jgi:hypothetical protein
VAQVDYAREPKRALSHLTTLDKSKTLQNGRLLEFAISGLAL